MKQTEFYNLTAHAITFSCLIRSLLLYLLSKRMRSDMTFIISRLTPSRCWTHKNVHKLSSHFDHNVITRRENYRL